MFKNIVLPLLFFLFVFNVANAQQVAQIDLSISENIVTVGDNFQINVTLKDASTGNINTGNINIPGIENFRQVGSSKSTQIQIVNGATTAVTETTFTLVALTPGNYEIGPININLGSASSTESNKVSLEVIDKKVNNIFGKSDKEAENEQPISPKKVGGFDFKKIFINIIAFFLLLLMVNRLRNRGNTKKDKDVYDVKENSERQDLPEINDKNFFVKSKEYVIAYVERKFAIDSASLTSLEVIEILEEKKAYKRLDIAQALELCDKGNFAYGKAGKEELLEILKKLR